MQLPWQYRWTALSCWSFPFAGGHLDVDADDDELPVPLRDDDHAGHEDALRRGRTQKVLQGNRAGAISSTVMATICLVWEIRAFIRTNGVVLCVTNFYLRHTE